MQGWVDLCYIWKRTGLELNPRPVNRKSNALPQRHHAARVSEVSLKVQNAQVLLLKQGTFYSTYHLEQTRILHSLYIRIFILLLLHTTPTFRSFKTANIELEWTDLGVVGWCVNCVRFSVCWLLIFCSSCSSQIRRLHRRLQRRLSASQPTTQPHRTSNIGHRH